MEIRGGREVQLTILPGGTVDKYRRRGSGCGTEMVEDGAERLVCVFW